MALATLNSCLGEDGFGEVRFLSAREIKGKEIIDVEVLEYDRSTLVSRIYLAGRVTLHLDRERGGLAIRFFDGHRWRERLLSL